MKILLRILLWPLSLPYALATLLRNFCYDRGILKSTSFDLPVIVLGNLRVGGSGKTPHTIWLDQKLSNYQTALLSRGYGRKTKGYLRVEATGTAAQFGDEPLLMKRKLQHRPVFVCENRVEGILQLLSEEPGTEVVLLDDAYQHRSLKAGMNILLDPYDHPWYREALLPAGRLRELPSGKKRAHCIIVTHCPADMDEAEAVHIRKKLKALKNQQVFFSCKKPLLPDKLINKSVWLLSGLADNHQFKASLEKQVHILGHFSYPDHHFFSPTDAEQIWEQVKTQKAAVLCSEKDHVKLQGLHQELDALLKPVALEIRFLFDGEKELLHQITSFVESHRDRFGDIHAH